MAAYNDLNVDIGNAPDDDQGDPLRTAFDKINQRFAELRVFLNNRGDWAPNTAYTADPNRDWVIVNGVGYLATSNHTSGATFAADLAAGKWVSADAVQLRADLGQPDGAKHVGGVDLQLADYAALRAYAGTKTRVYITGALGVAKPAGIAGVFQHDPTDTTTADNGGTVIVGSDGRRWKRDFYGPADAAWFGASGLGVLDDEAPMILAALAAHGRVRLNGHLYNIRSNIDVGERRLVGAGMYKTVLRCVSPSNDGRFGGSATNQAAVFALGVTGATKQGGYVADLSIECNGLLNATGTTGLKGVMFYKAHGCKADRVRVIDSRSYAFWCADAVGATDYASAVFEDCEESGSEIGFEAVNVSTCIFKNCRSEKPRVTSLWPVYSMFHAYGLTDSALVTFDNCYGRGRTSTVVDLALKCRNVQFIGGYFEQLTAGNGTFFFTLQGGDFSSIEFGNAVFKSAGFGGVLAKGDQAPSGTKAAKFIGGSISAANGWGVQIQDSNTLLEFVGTDVSANTTSGAAALCFVSEGTGNVVQFTGGSLRAVGGAGTAVSQGVAMRISDQTIQVPSTSMAPRVRQLVYGSGALQSGGDHAFINMIFPAASTASRVVVTAMINATGAANGAAAAGQATAFSFIPLDNQIYRLYAPVAAVGRNVRWQMTEYES